MLAGQATGAPNGRDGILESIRTLHVVKRSAIKALTRAANQMTNLIVAAPKQPARSSVVSHRWNGLGSPQHGGLVPVMMQSR